MRGLPAAGLIAAVVGCLPADEALGHFQVLIPSTDVVTADQPRIVTLDIVFTHPMEQGPVMEMERPRRLGVVIGGKKHDLLRGLKSRKVDGKTAFTCQARATVPGDYVFFLEPAPYWEPAERKMIIHYTKVVVDVMGAQKGWDAMVGFPIEIEPLVRPFGLWTGNTFRGIVKRGGRPVPFATIEVEYYNQGRKLKIPNDAFITQVLKADAAGVFSYTMPRAGWWGFAALLDGDQKIKGPHGKPVEVELGGLIWVKTVDMQ